MTEPQDFKELPPDAPAEPESAELPEADGGEEFGPPDQPPEPDSHETTMATEADRLNVAEEVRRLKESVEAGFAQLARRDAIVDKLHQELQDHRQGLLQQALEPTYKSLIHLYDDMGSVLQRESAAPEGVARSRVLSDLALFRDVVLEILYRQGIEPYTEEPGNAFDAKRHQVVRAIPLEDPAGHGKILEVTRPGFTASGRTFRPLMVHVGRHVPARAEPRQDATAE